MTQQTLENRRPLKVRGSRWSQKLAKNLSDRNITPNHISLLSIVGAAVAAVAFLLVSNASGLERDALYLIAIIGIQMRLLCNLFDGMVAVEGGKSTPSGELFNDIPDRISDPLIIVAAGYALLDVSWGGSLGWFTALLAVLTAYVRTLVTSIGAPTLFLGPMAKQHRMALLTVACVGCIIENQFSNHNWILLAAMRIMAVGCVITLAKRSLAAYHFLENKPKT